MVILKVRVRESGQTDAEARAHVLTDGEFGLIVLSSVRYLVMGDGVRTVGQLVDAGEHFVFAKDLAP